MTLLWTTPREWTTKDAITKERLNAISDDLNYLINPSRGIVTVRGTGSNQLITSTTFVDLDLATYQLSVEVTGVRDLNIKLHGLISNNTLAALTNIDFFIDHSIYVSSLTGTPLSVGVYDVTQYVAGNLIPVDIGIIIPAGVLAAGVHTVQPRIRVSAGTTTWYEAANLFSQFSFGE